MWWFLIETIAWLFLGSGEGGTGTWKRRRFREHFGVDYESLLGREMERYLNSIHSSPEGWAWRMSVVKADKKAGRFEVSYEDGYGQSGVVEVCLSGPAPVYRRIEREESA